MTNSIIPYSFVPGTKAKAQEVNANFIALAGQITENQTNTESQLNNLEETLTEKIDEVTETVSSGCATNDLTNTGFITNTVLEAPNGVAEYDGQTVNVKGGVKVLIPDGKTENGKLNNIEYTTENIITKTFTNMNNVNTIIFLSNNSTIDCINESHVIYKSSTPYTLVAGLHWYSIDENQWYVYDTSSSSWQPVSATPIARVVWNNGSVISAMTCTKPVNLVKTSDLSDFYTLRGILPKDLDYVIARYQSNWDFYVVYKSGWVKQGGAVSGNGDVFCSFYFPVRIGFHLSTARVSGGGTTSNIGVWARDIQTTYIKLYSNGDTQKVWCVEGYRLNTEEV